MRISRWLESNSGLIIALEIVVTALLVLPFLLMRPTQQAADDPGSEVFDVLDLSDDRFASSVYRVSFVVEARNLDMLRKAPLLELLDNENAVRGDPEVGTKIFSYFDSNLGTDILGIYSLADAVDGALRAQGVNGIAAGSDSQVKAAASKLIDIRGARRSGLSSQSQRDPSTGQWSAPALLVSVLANNDGLGGGSQRVTLGSDNTSKEKFARDVQRLMRGDQISIESWGIAIDVNLTSQEQGSMAGPFIGFTILAVLIVVGLTFRSYWSVAISGAALAAMIIWLKGLSNLIGLKDNLILSLIVPIAMISFGIDFAMHAVGRYREERRTGLGARPAFVAGLGGVMGALVVALASDTAAFLANAASGIESVIQFGIGAALGVLAAFLMLGVVTPLALMTVENRPASAPASRWRKFMIANGSIAAALTIMASVLFSVFLIPWVGVLILAAYLVIFVTIPYRMQQRRDDGGSAPQSSEQQAGRGAKAIGHLVARLAHARYVVLPVAAVVTGIATYFAVQLPIEGDVKVYFAPDTDFVVSLDKLDDHVGIQAGEPAQIYVEGDLTKPEALRALDQFAASVQRLDSHHLARDENGQVVVQMDVLNLVRDVVESPPARAAILASTGVQVSDEDSDGLPDSDEQLRALYSSTRAAGVPHDESRLAWTPDRVRSALWVSDNRNTHATRLWVQIVGSRAQENVFQARDELEPLVNALGNNLRGSQPDARAVLTGGPIVREVSLDAIARALQVSLPIAVILCLIVAGVFTRSVRYAVVSVIPILLVVAWLYAFMYAFGFGINLVTATIGAISIGIGVDFAIHLTMRFREELRRHRTREHALQAAGTGTGVALIASAVSSVLGFAILAFAPMPLFATYGLLTAVMILMALVGSLLVLPSLLMLVTKDRTQAV